MTKYRPPLFNFGNGSMATVFGIGVYGKRSDAWWHRAFIRPIFRIGNRVHNARLWFMYRFVREHRYHLVDTHLDPGYYDADYLMLNACFSLLRRYVEDEMGGVERLSEWSASLAAKPDKYAPEASLRQSSNDAEAVALYRWWMEKRPADIKRKDELLHYLYSEKRAGPMFVDDPDTGLMKYQGPKWEDSDVVLHEQMRALEETIDREEQEMLHRLIDIRGGLWT